MENHGEEPNHGNNRSSERNEQPVRSRWTPKPEQILILESIFNSGMVNPPKDETVRIRKLLEKFGSVGDANVFYWFQNRRSRSRRRQRQMQAAAVTFEQTNNNQSSSSDAAAAASIIYDASTSNYPTAAAGGGSTSSTGGGGRGSGVDASHFSITSGNQIVFPEIEHGATPSFYTSVSDTSSNIHFQSGGGGRGYIVIFINGVPTEVPKGSVDLKTMFGNDSVLVHSSGLPVLTNQFGFSLHSLHPGENYFLVSSSRTTTT